MNSTIPQSQHPTITRADIKAAPSHPVLVLPADTNTVNKTTTSSSEQQHQQQSASNLTGLPVNEGDPIPIHSDIFTGKAKIFIKGLDNTPPHLFNTQKRRSLLIIQGQFTNPNINFNDIITGQEFSYAKNLPPSWLVNSILRRIAQIVSPSLEIGKDLSAPYAVMPVVAGAQGVHIAVVGKQPEMTVDVIHEDMTLTDPHLSCHSGTSNSVSRRTSLDGTITGIHTRIDGVLQQQQQQEEAKEEEVVSLMPISSRQRQKHFSHCKNRENRTFSTEYVYTFYFIQHVVDLSTYTLHMLRRWNLFHYLGREQPMQLMVKNKMNNEYVFRFLVWHIDMLPNAEEGEEEGSTAVGGEVEKGGGVESVNV